MILAATTTNDDLLGGVNDFFDSGAWMVIRNLGIFFVAVFWLATAYWVYKDARRRIEDPWLVAMAAVLGLVPPFVGPIIYLFFRPPEYIEDVRERELEIRAMEERLSEAGPAVPFAAPRRGDLPRHGLHDAAETGMREVQRAARSAVADLPPLRDARHDAGPARDRRHDRRLLDGSPKRAAATSRAIGRPRLPVLFHRPASTSDAPVTAR